MREIKIIDDMDIQGIIGGMPRLVAQKLSDYVSSVGFGNMAWLERDYGDMPSFGEALMGYEGGLLEGNSRMRDYFEDMGRWCMRHGGGNMARAKELMDGYRDMARWFGDDEIVDNGDVAYMDEEGRK